MKAKANAKVNLFLRVLGRRDDGFHDIESVFNSVTLTDTVTVELGGDPGIRIRTEPDLGIADEANLAYRAAKAFSDACGRELSIEISLRKEIPAGAGLGGGSSDAAAVLRALQELFGQPLDRGEVERIAGDLGSDVPHALIGGPALVTGRGTHVSALQATCDLWLVLALSREFLATADVYRAWDDVGTTSSENSDQLKKALRLGDVQAVGAALHNDLEPVTLTLRPQLADTRSVLLSEGALGVVMSGSGPTYIGLARDESEARRVAAAVKEIGPPGLDRVAVVTTLAPGLGT